MNFEQQKLNSQFAILDVLAPDLVVLLQYSVLQLQQPLPHSIKLEPPPKFAKELPLPQFATDVASLPLIP